MFFLNSKSIEWAKYHIFCFTDVKNSLTLIIVLSLASKSSEVLPLIAIKRKLFEDLELPFKQ